MSAMNIIILKEKMKSDEWIEVASSQENKFFIKSKNVSKEGVVIKFWWKAEIKNKTITTNGKRTTYANVKQLALVASDCDSKQVKFYSTIFYNSKGSVIQSSNEETS